MKDLSVIIPARNEEFLQQTINNVLENIEANTEVIAVLDGYWPDKGIARRSRLNILHFEQPIGQRAATNRGAQASNAKFIMKLDAHCAVDKGFDIKLMADCEYEDTIVPAMYNLHAFDWVCKHCGHRIYQGPYPSVCKKCNTSDTESFEKKIVWKPKHNPRSEFYYFDMEMKFQYWREFKKRPEAQGDLAPTLGNLGACFFMHRRRFFDLGGMDEAHGFWGQFGTEISCKAWLSGGRQLVNKKTWFSHMFRTGNGFGFPYKLPGKEVRKARKYSQDLWKNNLWPLAKYNLDWLIKKFAPVPTWDVKPEAVPETVPEIEAKPQVVINKTPKKLKKGAVYYTDNQCEERILRLVRDNLSSVFDGPIVSVSQFPIDFAQNIVVELHRSVLTMFKQILAGAEALDADVIFLTEHDIIYHPSHFEFAPPNKDMFYYNYNCWKVDVKTGQALFYYTKQTSQVCAYKEVLVDHYRNRVKRVEQEGFTRRMGFEPGTHKYPRGFDSYESDTYMSAYPNLDLRHAHNLTSNRFKKEQFRSQRSIKGWTMADEVPFWGRTKGCFDEFLKNLSISLSKSKKGGARDGGGSDVQQS